MFMCTKKNIHIKLYSSYSLMATINSLHIPSSCLEVWSKWLKSTTASIDFMQVNLMLFVLLGVAILWLLSWKTLKKGGNPPMPGPRGLPLVGHLPFLDRELHTYFSYLAKKYGPIVKLMLGNKVGVVISSPSLSREVLKDHDITFANRDVPPVAAMITMYGGKDIVWTSYGPEWRMLKKVSMLKMLSNITLDSSYNLRRLELRKTINYMYNQVGSPVNIGEQMFLNSLNVITNMMWGGVKGEERSSLGTEFRQVVGEVTELLGTPNVSDFFPSLASFDLQGVEKRIKAVIPKLDRIFDTMIDQRLRINQDKDSGNGTKDFLQYMLELKDEQDAKTPFTMAHLKAMLMEMVLAGTDTSSNTIEFAMAEIMKRPHIMRKAQQEMDAIVGKDIIVEESHIHRLPYLNAIMKETLRLHPTVPLLVPHCPKQTCTVGGYTVPKGSRVFINVWAIHRDPEVWANPAEFDPERFLNSQVLDFSGNDFRYFPFGSGRRICAGIAMAERMIMYSLASLLHSFDWKMPNEEKIDLSEKFGIVLKMKVPLIAIPLPRLSDPALYE